MYTNAAEVWNLTVPLLRPILTLLNININSIFCSPSLLHRFTLQPNHPQHKHRGNALLIRQQVFFYAARVAAWPLAVGRRLPYNGPCLYSDRAWFTLSARQPQRKREGLCEFDTSRLQVLNWAWHIAKRERAQEVHQLTPNSQWRK